MNYFHPDYANPSVHAVRGHDWSDHIGLPPGLKDGYPDGFDEALFRVEGPLERYEHRSWANVLKWDQWNVDLLGVLGSATVKRFHDDGRIICVTTVGERVYCPDLESALDIGRRDVAWQGPHPLPHFIAMDVGIARLADMKRAYAAAGLDVGREGATLVVDSEPWRVVDADGTVVFSYPDTPPIWTPA